MNYIVIGDSRNILQNRRHFCEKLMLQVNHSLERRNDIFEQFTNNKKPATSKHLIYVVILNWQSNIQG